ncbi:unnamed protein product [Mucor hiemalis]
MFEEGWYSGRIENTSDIGLFPFNYVERIHDSVESTTPIPVTETPEPISPSIKIPSSKRTTGNKSVQSRSVVTSDNSTTTVLPGFPALDAFEAAMSGKGSKTSTTSSSLPIISPKPKLVTKSVIAEKPQLKNLNLNGDASPTRLRSYSTSSVLNKEEPVTGDKTLRPSQLLQGKGTKSALELALSKGSPATNSRIQSKLRSNSFSKQNHNPGGMIGGGVPLIGMANLKLNSSVSNDVEEEDGFQMVKPSQLRQRQQQQQQSSPSPTISKSSAPTSSYSNKPIVSSWKNSQESVNKVNVLNNSPKKSTSSKLEDVPVSTSPMPRLPSRPVSNASRRSKTSRGNSLNTTPSTTPPIKVENAPDKAAPPVLKPKPVIAQPVLSRGSSNKTRSSSNPPPLQPKPAAMSSIEVLLSKNNNALTEKKKIPESTTTPPPRVASNKPSVAPYQPKSQLNKSSLSGATNDLDKWKSPDYSNDSTDTNIKPSALFNRARSSTNPTSNIDWSNAMTKRTTTENKPEIKKKATPPPPPPSRPPKNNKFSSNHIMDEVSKHRYEILFDTIHDDGYVDGETARFIWMKSKLSSEELSRVWRECDPDLKGLLDKHAFIEGMGRIDELLMHKQQQVVL